MSQQITLRHAETKRAYMTETGFIVAIIKKVTNDPEQRMRATPDPKSIVSVKIRRMTDQVDMDVDPETPVTQLTSEALKTALEKYEQEHPQLEGELEMAPAKKPAKSKGTSKGFPEEPPVTTKGVVYGDTPTDDGTPAPGAFAKTEKKPKAPKEQKEKKETLADVINPMLQAKKYTAAQIADAVIAKFPDREYPASVKDPKHYLIGVICTVRLKYAQDKFGAANVGLVEDKTPAPAKEKKEPKAKKDKK